MGYLMLSRRENEKIMITCPDGNVLKIVIAEISEEQEKRQAKVRMGFSGPQDYIFDREEIFHQKRDKKNAANKSAAPKDAVKAKSA